MSINKTLALKWGDKSYDIKITMGLIDRVEESLNAVMMLNQAINGDVRFSKVARLVSILLNSVGEKVTAEEVWEAMFSDGSTTSNQACQFAIEALSAMFPDPPKKKPETQGSPKRQSTSTRGKTSTK